MGRYLFRLPDIGEGVAEAEIVAWHVQPGDIVREDQSLVDVMTDKATVDMTSPVDGIVKAVHGAIGTMMPVGTILVEFDVEGDGEAGHDQSSEPDTPIPIPMPMPMPMPMPINSEAPVSAETNDKKTGDIAQPAIGTAVPSERRLATGNSDPLAAPATRRRAHELGISLRYVVGTGPGGRITSGDLDAWIAHGGQQQVAAGPMPRAGINDIPIIGMRRKVAEKMQEAKRRIPHITYVEECDLTELEALRIELNAHRQAERPKLTLLPFFIQALVNALPDFPQINARYDDEAGILHAFEGVHVGIATQTPAGLVVPVIRHAEARDIWDCAAELGRVTAAARDGSAKRETLSGSTITITSLGTLGGIAATPIINHPEVAIIAPNKLVDRPTIQGSFVAIRKIMNISASFDHRIVDGHDAARFIQRMKRSLEHPALLFMPRAAGADQ